MKFTFAGMETEVDGEAVGRILWRSYELILEVGEPAKLEYVQLYEHAEFYTFEGVVEALELVTRLHILLTYTTPEGRYWIINRNHPLWKHYTGNRMVRDSGVIMGRAIK